MGALLFQLPPTAYLLQIVVIVIYALDTKLPSAFTIAHHTYITDHIFYFLLLFVVFAVTSDSPKDDLPVR